MLQNLFDEKDVIQSLFKLIDVEGYIDSCVVPKRVQVKSKVCRTKHKRVGAVRNVTTFVFDPSAGNFNPLWA